jgi:hypothetical protein
MCVKFNILGSKHFQVINTKHRKRTGIEKMHRSRDWVINTLASYLGGPNLKSRPEDRLSWLDIFSCFLSPPTQTPG